MKLADAHKTGKRYRRKNSKTGWDSLHEYDTEKHSMDLADAIADDWEVEPEVYEVELLCESQYFHHFQHAIFILPNTIGHSELVGRRCAITIKPLD